MFNKLYEWIGTGLASLRSGAPGTVSETAGVKQDGRIRRKRPINCVEDEEGAAQEDGTAKRSRIGDLMDTMKTAAEGVKNQGSSMALWMRSSLNPSLSSILTSTGHSSPAALQLDLPSPAASVSRNSEFLVHTSSASDDIFIAPSTSVGCSIFSTDSLSLEEPLYSLKTCRRQVCPDPVQNQTPKTNGHSASLSAFKSPNSCPCPRLGRSLLLGARRSLSHVPPMQESTGSSSLPRAHEKSAPARMVQSLCARRSRFHRRRPFCTAQESVREEEKEVYRQLLAVVSGTHCPLFRDGTLSTPLRSHRDLTSFLTSSRRLLQSACSVPERRVEALDRLSGPPSPLGESSLSSSNVPSPGGESSEADSQVWPGLCHLHPASPQAAAACDTSSQGTQSSAQDGDSVIFVKEEQPRETDSSSVPCFKAELWIKELTSLYDSRARERRRLIEEQEALATQLLHQRLSEQSHVTPSGIELQVRVPLEKEVPLAPIVEELKPKEDVEFPELTEAMEREINRALRGGSPDEVLSEGFRLTITRKDLQTLSHLNWLNDEVINFYMNLLVERSQQPALPSVYTFNTFFYPKLRSAGFSAVRRWTKKVDIFSFDILLVPVHLGVHWCLSVVDFRNKSVTYFDSMGGNNDEACRMLLKYLEQEGKDKKGHVLDASQWVLQSKKRHEIPQQMNGSDCGMFTCKYADYITKDKAITFTQKHMPYFRRRMVWEILNRKLL